MLRLNIFFYIYSSLSSIALLFMACTNCSLCSLFGVAIFILSAHDYKPRRKLTWLCVRCSCDVPKIHNTLFRFALWGAVFFVVGAARRLYLHLILVRCGRAYEIVARMATINGMCGVLLFRFDPPVLSHCACTTTNKSGCKIFPGCYASNNNNNSNNSQCCFQA